MAANLEAHTSDVAAAPIDVEERLVALDILRGIALFGMILVHFHQKMRLDATGVEDLVGYGVWILVEQKAWGTFAFLFGVGFAILLRRLEARQAPVALIYVRRLVALAGFGVIAEVGFGFHVLFTYACWGLVLLLVRRWSTPALLLLAVSAVAVRPVVAEVGILWPSLSAAPLPHLSGLEQAVDAASAGSSYLSLLLARWHLFVATTPAGWRTLLPDTNLGLFLAGFLALRHGVIDDPMRHARLIKAWMLGGALSWLTYWVALRHLEQWPLGVGLGLIQDQWLCFTYIGAVVLLLAHRPEWKHRLASIGLAGRMALTNYLLQAMWLDVLGSGYGFGLRLRPYVYVVAALLLFSVEMLLAGAWLARFRYGPLEWIWRVVTYARGQRLRHRLA